MGNYLNPGNEGFRESVRSKIYVDKTGLIAWTNELINTEQKYICVSRPRRFGKSMTLKMLAYGSERREAFIPNKEIREEFENSMRAGGWPEVMNVLKASEQLLEDTLSGREDSVAVKNCRLQRYGIMNGDGLLIRKIFQ